MSDPRCAITRSEACAWGGMCAPGRCIAAEAEGSPHYAAFAPKESDSRPRHCDGRAAGGCNRVVPSGTDDRGASLALACGFGAGLLALIALAAARWWGWL